MPSQIPQPPLEEILIVERRRWHKPAFNRLETGEAEAQDGTGTDAAQALS